MDEPDTPVREQLGVKLPQAMSGMMLREWWDSCSEAGPAKRERGTFGEPTPTLESLSLDQGSLATLSFH